MKPPVLAFLVYVGLLGAWLANEALTLAPRFHHLPDSVDSQAAILERRPFELEGKTIDYPVWRHRIVMPLAIEGLARATSLSRSQAYLVLRWVTACLALAAFTTLLKQWLRASYWFIAAGLALFTLVLGPTFLHVYDIPSDFLDAAAMALLTLFALQKRAVAFAVVFFPALLNREGAVFALLAWLAFHFQKEEGHMPWRQLLFPGLVGAVGVALVILLRRWNAIPDAAAAGPLQPLIPWETHVDQIRSNLLHPHPGNPLYYLLGLVVLFGTVIRQNWTGLAPMEKRLVFVAAGVAIVSGLFGNLVELRTQMAALVWCSFLAVVILHRRLISSTTGTTEVPA